MSASATVASSSSGRLLRGERFIDGGQHGTVIEGQREKTPHRPTAST
jgi:hypothetical protein